MIPMFKTRVIFNIVTIIGYQVVESQYESLGEDGGDKGKKECIYYWEPIWIPIRTFNYISHSSSVIDGVVQGEEQGLEYGVH